jgi:hypothetical protein
MLKFQFFGNQRGANPQICYRRFRPHPHDGFCTPFTKILQQSLNERLAEQVTTTLGIPVNVSSTLAAGRSRVDSAPLNGELLPDLSQFSG